MCLRFMGVDFTDLCSMSLKVFKLLRLEFYIYTFETCGLELYLFSVNLGYWIYGFRFLGLWVQRFGVKGFRV